MTALAFDRAGGIDGRGLGHLVAGDLVLTLGAPPDLGFAYDAVEVDTEHGLSLKWLEGDASALTDAELASLATYLSAFGSMNEDVLVWGLDSAGNPLGLVPSSQAASVSPPQPTGDYVWNASIGTWQER